MRIRQNVSFAGLLVAGLFGLSGCDPVTTGAAAGAAGGFAVGTTAGYCARGKTTRMYDLPVESAAEAVRQACADVRIAIRDEDAENGVYEFDGRTADGFPVSVAAERKLDDLSAVTVRVGHRGNTELNLQLHDVIRARAEKIASAGPVADGRPLPPPVEPAPVADASDALTFGPAE